MKLILPTLLLPEVKTSPQPEAFFRRIENAAGSLLGLRSRLMTRLPRLFDITGLIGGLWRQESWAFFQPLVFSAAKWLNLSSTKSAPERAARSWSAQPAPSRREKSA
jgi:hypothetical protein